MTPHARKAHKDTKNRDRQLRETTTSEECTIVVIQMLVEDPGSTDETIFGKLYHVSIYDIRVYMFAASRHMICAIL